MSWPGSAGAPQFGQLAGCAPSAAGGAPATACSCVPGSTVVLYDCDSGEEVTYKLVMAEDADVVKGRISTVSPIGKGLMGKVAGEKR